MLRDAGGIQIATFSPAHQIRNNPIVTKPTMKQAAENSTKDARSSRT